MSTGRSSSWTAACSRRTPEARGRKLTRRKERAWPRRTSRTCWWILSSRGASRGSTGWPATRSTASPSRSGGRSNMRWVHVRHEETAAFAAGADAHLTGRLAVCAGSCGPGNLHLINGLYDCHRSRVPVLAIAAQIPSARDRQRLLPGDPSRASLRPVQPLLRAGVPARADAARARDRHSDGAVAARGVGHRPARRRGLARCRRAGRRACTSPSRSPRCARPTTRSPALAKIAERVDEDRRSSAARAVRARTPS